MGQLLRLLLLCCALQSLLAEESYFDRAQAAIKAERLSDAKRLLLLALNDDLNDAQRRQVEEQLAKLKARQERSSEDEFVNLRQQVVALLSGPARDPDAWAAFAELQRQRPDHPLLAFVQARFKPDWAVAGGHDHHGHWATRRLGRYLVRFRLIAAGSLRLDERIVTVANDFWISETEITTGQATALGPALAGLQEDQPCLGLSPGGIVALVQAFDRALPFDAMGRLPSPEEWEFAARDGCTDPQPEWFVSHTDGVFDRLSPAKCASCRCSTNGLLDVLGSAWELVEDKRGQWWACGGSWRSRYEHCRFDLRRRVARHRPDVTLGFRLVISERP